MRVKDLYRKELLQYKKMSPLQVSLELFTTIGNAALWDENGEMSDPMAHDPDWSPDDRKMHTSPGYDRLNIKWRLEHETWKIRREFVIKNIDDILECPADTELFREESVQISHYARNPAVGYAAAFNFPENIAQDWASALLEFSHWWIAFLRQTYGVRYQGTLLNEIAHWNKGLRDAHHRLQANIKELERISAGLTHEQYAEREKELDKLVEEIIADE